ncbi:MAG: hypothetical protein ACFE0Q_05115 [Anaerolineae bacterium]
MLESMIVIIIAGSIWAMSQQFNKTNRRVLLTNDALERRSLSVISEGGLYQLATPSQRASMRAFRELHLIEGGVRLYDNLTQQAHMIDFSTIQWVQAVTFPQEEIAATTLHLEVARRWQILTIQMPKADMVVFVNMLNQVVSGARSNLGRPPARPIGPLNARMSEDTLQGESVLGAEVSLYLLPHMLIVLQGDVVQAKIDTSSIRRVLSVERISGRLDSLLNPSTPDGAIRLYSLYETVSFVLPQFRELAEEISYLSRCPVEFITQDDKSGKQ